MWKLGFLSRIVLNLCVYYYFSITLFPNVQYVADDVRSAVYHSDNGDFEMMPIFCHPRSVDYGGPFQLRRVSLGVQIGI